MRRPHEPVIALLTDFGTADWYVPVLKGVLLDRCPDVRLVDLTHDIPPHDMMAGALTLAQAAPWYPGHTVFLAVVDPGVGTDRGLVAVKTRSGQRFVGPDNGLLAPAVERRITQAVRLTQRRFWASPVSATFHARDILAPVAAHLAGGGALKPLGPSLSRLQPLDLPPIERTDGGLLGAIVHADRFGNLITNVPASAAPPGSRIRIRGKIVRMVRSYANGRRGEAVALIGSSGRLELAVNCGSAARTLRARRGQRLEVLHA